MEVGDVFGLLIVVVGLVSLIIYLSRRSFALQEKKLETEARLAAEKAAQYAAHVERIEERLRVIEKIVTDRGAETAAQIEALRDAPRIGTGDKVQ